MDVWPTSALVGGILIAALALSALAASANGRSVQPESIRAPLRVRWRAVVGRRGGGNAERRGSAAVRRCHPLGNNSSAGGHQGQSGPRLICVQFATETRPPLRILEADGGFPAGTERS
jgi:hypothetical protein